MSGFVTFFNSSVQDENFWSKLSGRKLMKAVIVDEICTRAFFQSKEAKSTYLPCSSNEIGSEPPIRLDYGSNLYMGMVGMS